jgi:hypothetical protein
MRILFLTDNFPPEVNAPAARTYEHCRQWVKQGAEVTVITCAPNFPQGRVFSGYRNKPYQTENKDGLRIIRVWSYMTANTGVVKRTLDYVSFACTGFWAGMFQKADVIIATSPQFFTAWAGWALAKLKRRPFVFEVRDLWPESIATVGAVQRGVVLRVLEEIELILYRQAAAVVVVTPGLKDNLVYRSIAQNKVYVISNGVDNTVFAPRPKDEELVEKLGLENKFVISFIGTHGLAHGLEFIVSCLDELQDPGVHFLFIGEGAEKLKVRALAKERGINNCTFLDLVPRNQVPHYISASDAALVHLKDREMFQKALPSKMFEAAAMQRPILLGVDGLARELIETYQAGIFFQPENKESFLQAVQRLKEDRELYTACQKGCRRLAEDFDRRKKAEEMYQILQKVSGSDEG